MNPLNLHAKAELPMGTTLLYAAAGLRCHLGFYREGSAQAMATRLAKARVSVFMLPSVNSA